MGLQTIIDKYSSMDDSYENCQNLIADLNEVGYTCDFDLSGGPTEIRQLTKAEQALNKVTYEMALNIKNGEEIKLNETYSLYCYENGDSLVIVETDSWEEIYWVQYNSENKTIEYGEL